MTPRVKVKSGTVTLLAEINTGAAPPGFRFCIRAGRRGERISLQTTAIGPRDGTLTLVDHTREAVLTPKELARFATALLKICAPEGK